MIWWVTSYRNMFGFFLSLESREIKNKLVSINCILLLLLVPELCMYILFAPITSEQSSENSQAKKARTNNWGKKYVFKKKFRHFYRWRFPKWITTLTQTRCFCPCFHILTIKNQELLLETPPLLFPIPTAIHSAVICIVYTAMKALVTCCCIITPQYSATMGS